MQFNLNITELFKSHFGFQVGIATRVIADQILNPFQDIEVIESNAPANAVSRMGTPVWDYVSIKPKIIEGTGESFGGFDFPLECVTEVILPKKIVETEIIGRDGDVEELMGVKDWMITFRGFIINYDTQDYPEDALKELKDFAALKTTLLDVESTFLNLLDIYHLSIHKLILPAAAGYSHVQPFELEAKSKIPFTVNASNGILL
ncbi:MAG: DUF6046 domain-containing protein [Leeuwenhoekiella sp.]|uniref:DUF6046 domain-containing protein n=1 Tax=Leeuwenhoekiella sp. TaxID=1977054 RepID=UPI003241CECA